MRHVILHNHLFKNAGTSVDHILRQNFPDRWVTREFEGKGEANTADVARWITDHPKAVAFSSHTLLGPLPRIEGTQIVPVVMLRDPVDRIASAYRFERVQQAETRGTHLARAHGLAGYVHARLSHPGDRQCRNFQTARLAALAPDHPGTELDRAKVAMRLVAQSGVLGLVSEFPRSMTRLQSLVSPWFRDFSWQPVTANASSCASANTVSPAMRMTLVEANADDMKLLQDARQLTGQTSTVAGTDQLAGMA